MFWVVVCAAAVNAAAASPAWAYVDPSVMTYTIQALAGVAVALSAVAGVAFRRGRRLLYELLDIDEDARKTHEPEVHRVGGEGVGGSADATVGAASSNSAGSVPADGAADADAADAARDKKRSQRRDGLGAYGWRRRLGIALAVCLFASMTLLVLAPLEIVAASAGSLVFSVRDVAVLVIGVGVVAAAVAALILSSLRGRPFGLVVLLLFALALGAYVQALFLNAGLPPADGNNVDWASFMPITVVSAIVWIALLVLVMGVGHVQPKRMVGVATVMSCALAIVQGVGAASLLVSPQDAVQAENDGLHAHVAAAGSPAPTEDGLFEVSEHGNIVVFVLDTFDTAQLQRLVADDSGLLDEFTGFTWFDNASGSMIPTRYAIPCMLTGEVPRAGELFSTYLSERYLRSSFLSDLHECGYSIGLYSDSLNLEYLSGSDAADIAALTVNLHAASTSNMDAVGTWLALMKCALYRDVPWLFKPSFWFYTDEINAAMVAYNPEGDPAETMYLMDDPQYYERLQRFGLTVADRDGENAFRFIHLIGPHGPYNMDEKARDVGLDNSNIDAQAIGSLHIVDDYLARLKELGIYDDATIIVTADHGTWFSTFDPLEVPSVPIMLVKPAQTHDDAAQPVAVSHAAVGHFDMQATIIAAAGGDAGAYGPTMFAVDGSDAARARDYYATTNDGAHDREIVEYTIAGNALDAASWHETGERWAAQE